MPPTSLSPFFTKMGCLKLAQLDHKCQIYFFKLETRIWKVPRHRLRFNSIPLGSSSDPTVSRPVRMVIFLMFAQQLSGINSVIVFTVNIFQSSGKMRAQRSRGGERQLFLVQWWCHCRFLCKYVQFLWYYFQLFSLYWIELFFMLEGKYFQKFLALSSKGRAIYGMSLPGLLFSLQKYFTQFSFSRSTFFPSFSPGSTVDPNSATMMVGALMVLATLGRTDGEGEKRHSAHSLALTWIFLSNIYSTGTNRLLF